MAPEYWQVRIALEDDWDIVRRALFVVVPAERWTINLKGGDEVETATLVLEVLAESYGEAEDEAERHYTSARREAGLSERSPLMIGVRTPIFGPEPYERLLEESRRLIETDRYELAVIRAQTACELFARLAVDKLTAGLRKPEEKLGTLMPRLSLLDRRSRALMHALTGSDLADQPWWPDYRAHVTRRNGIVHDGLVVSEAEANASREAARQFIAHLGWLWAGQPADPFQRQMPP